MKLLTTILINLAFLSFVVAQKGMTFHYLHTIPVGEFNEHLMHKPSGISFEFMASPFKDKKLQLGVNISVSMYQNEDYEGEVEIQSFQKAYVETNEDDCFYTYQAFVRYYLQAEQKLLRPYIQGQAGGATFFSTLSVLEDAEDAFDDKTRNHGTALLAGLGAGMAIKIFDSMYLDASLTYNSSSTTNYRTSPEQETKAQYRIDLSSHQQKTKVDHLALKLGMNIVF